MSNNRNIALLLCVFNSVKNQIEGRTKLQKMIYLLLKEYKIPFSFNFKPYFYGPYSAELSDVLDDLTSVGLIYEDVECLSPRIFKYKYYLTKTGQTFVQNIKEQPEKADINRELIDRVSKISLKLNSYTASKLIKKAKAI